MSRENVDLVRETFRRFQEGDPGWADTSGWLGYRSELKETIEAALEAAGLRD